VGTRKKTRGENPKGGTLSESLGKPLGKVNFPNPESLNPTSATHAVRKRVKPRYLTQCNAYIK